MGQARQVKLLTFATASFCAQQASLNWTAARGGITSCVPWTEAAIRATEFYRNYRNILDAERGAGYWLWKPYLICRELSSINNGDFLVYHDVGRASMPHRISRSLSPLLDWCEKHNGGILPGVYVPEYGPSTRWTKRECFLIMDCDEPRYWEHPQIQATFSIWQKSDMSRAFAEEWLRWCITPGALTDDVLLTGVCNFPDFVDHRHDQSVVTNLSIKRGIKCFGDPNRSMRGSKDINNLVDKIAGKNANILCRTALRTLERRFRSTFLTS